ncbi:MAG: glucoamylase family protein, partial [Lacibacter sp.]
MFPCLYHSGREVNNINGGSKFYGEQNWLAVTTNYHMKYFVLLVFLIAAAGCKKKNEPPPEPKTVLVADITIDNQPFYENVYGASLQPKIKIRFTQPVSRATVSTAMKFSTAGGTDIPVVTSFMNGDSVLQVQISSALAPLTKYVFQLTNVLKSASNGPFITPVNNTFLTVIDSTDKFPVLSDDALLDKVQQQTFKYFWDFGHPTSGMARERNTSTETVTTGGTGFGIMAIVAAVHRGFITRAEGRDRILKITNFLINNCTRYHGVFAHWIYGNTGQTQPFSTNDNGADLVETSFLLEGLITARQYFTGTDAAETELRTKINSIWDAVEWNWFRQGGQNVLYWHWSPDKGWIMNHQIKGWNEALIVYVLASSSRTDSIPKIVYDNGWASNGAIVNNNTYYGYKLPLGSTTGGPLF